MSVSVLFDTFLIQWRICNYSPRRIITLHPRFLPLSLLPSSMPDFCGWMLLNNVQKPPFIMSPSRNIEASTMFRMHDWLTYREFSGFSLHLASQILGLTVGRRLAIIFGSRNTFICILHTWGNPVFPKQPPSCTSVLHIFAAFFFYFIPFSVFFFFFLQFAHSYQINVHFFTKIATEKCNFCIFLEFIKSFIFFPFIKFCLFYKVLSLYMTYIYRERE